MSDKTIDRLTERAEIDNLRAINAELLEACKKLIEQFSAYRNGWLGNDWRDRIGLQDALNGGAAAILKAEVQP